MGGRCPPTAGPAGDPATRSATRRCQTGDALAVGVDAATTIIQDVDATADGGTIDASQTAVVANVGLGVANTGG